MVRPSKTEYYLNIAKEVAARSTCLCLRGGAIIVKDDQIVATGYNGAPRKTKDCLERGNCLRRELNIPSGHRYEFCRTVHAEQNAIINAARAGVSILGGTMYLHGCRVFNGKTEKSDMLPCFICKKMILNAGLEKVVCSTKDGKFKIYDVAEWAKDWREKDIIEDTEKYETDYSE
ncbi:MAG: deoxycytidylate deaminase [Candidatus Aenigmatarchaeota archaeon]